MKPTPITTILEHLTDGNAIAMFRGTLASVWEHKSGQHAHGDWSIQNGSFSDGNQTILVQFKDRPPIPEELKGQELVVLAFNGQKGLSGIYAIDDTNPKTGETKRKIRITKTATIQRAIDYDDGPGHPEANPDRGWPSEDQIRQDEVERQKRMVAEHNQTRAAQPTAPPRENARQADHGDRQDADLKDAKTTLVQIANLHILCRIAIERQEAPILKQLTGRDMGEGELQAATSSLFIKGDKLGLHTKMPTRPFTPADFPTR